MSNARSVQEIAGLLLLTHSVMYILLTSADVQGGPKHFSHSLHLSLSLIGWEDRGLL